MIRNWSASADNTGNVRLAAASFIVGNKIIFSTPGLMILRNESKCIWGRHWQIVIPSIPFACKRVRTRSVKRLSSPVRPPPSGMIFIRWACVSFATIQSAISSTRETVEVFNCTKFGKRTKSPPREESGKIIGIVRFPSCSATALYVFAYTGPIIKSGDNKFNSPTKRCTVLGSRSVS